MPRGSRTAAPPPAVDDVLALLAVFRFERFVYLFFASASLLLIIMCAGRTIWNGTTQIADLAGIFGSSGIMGFSLSRVLTMFDKALDYIGRGR